MINVEIIYKGNEFSVSGVYTPGEPEILYFANGDPGHPGSPSEFEIHEIIWNGSNVTDLIENICDMNEISNICREEIETNNN